MNENPNILIYYVLNREIMMISIYVDNFFLVSNCFITLKILQKILSQKYSNKNLG